MVFRAHSAASKLHAVPQILRDFLVLEKLCFSGNALTLSTRVFFKLLLLLFCHNISSLQVFCLFFPLPIQTLHKRNLFVHLHKVIIGNNNAFSIS